MPEPETRYPFARSERGIFCEIYFPKRAAYMGKIFDSLRYGLNEKVVKKYLHRNVQALLDEFRSYPALFDPNNYSTTKPRTTSSSLEEARERIEMYKSPFAGWSIYSADGVFFIEIEKEGKVKMDEEAVQVVRIMFRFKSSFKTQAEEANCNDVLRSILFWVIGQQGRLHKAWSAEEKRKFIARHEPWSKHKKVFAEQYFTDIAKEVTRWIDDRALFVFGYLVRQFWEHVLAEKMYEAEIWVSSLFDQLLNVVKREIGRAHV